MKAMGWSIGHHENSTVFEAANLFILKNSLGEKRNTYMREKEKQRR
jgi:hypothetical protein